MGMGQTVPAFEEVLEAVGGSIGMNLHVRPGVVDRVIEMCSEGGVLDSAFLAIEGAEDIRRVWSRYPDVWVCSLYHQGEPDLVEANVPLGVRLLQPAHGILTPELVEAAHRAGMVMGFSTAILMRTTGGLHASAWTPSSPTSQMRSWRHSAGR